MTREDRDDFLAFAGLLFAIVAVYAALVFFA